MNGIATRAATDQLVDSLINSIRHKSALVDLHGRPMAYSDTPFQGASQFRRALKNWIPSLKSPNADLDTRSRKTLMARGRDAYRNQPLARAPITRAVTNVVGTGLRLQSQPDYKTLGMDAEAAIEWADNTEREFSAYFESTEVDAERTLNGYGLQALALLSTLMSGDCIAATPYIERPGSIYATKIQLIEADRLRNKGNAANTNRLFDGISFDDYGAPVNYHILKVDPGNPISYSTSGEWDILPAFGASTGRRRTMHIFWKERPGQSRGVCFIAPILEPLRQLNNYTENELMAAVVSSLFTVFIKSESGEFTLGAESDPNAQSGLDASREMTMGNGKIIELMPGEDISSASMTRPNAQFESFVNAVYISMGAALEIPVDELLLRYVASYSAARAAMLQAWKFYKTRREWISLMFCQPFFELWLDEAVARGRIKAPDYGDPIKRAAYARSEWYGPARGAVDENKEIQAAEKRINLGISSIAIEAQELKGVDSERIHTQRVREMTRRVADGLEANVNALQPGSTPQKPDIDLDEEAEEINGPAKKEGEDK